MTNNIDDFPAASGLDRGRARSDQKYRYLGLAKDRVLPA